MQGTAVVADRAPTHPASTRSITATHSTAWAIVRVASSFEPPDISTPAKYFGPGSGGNERLWG